MMSLDISDGKGAERKKERKKSEQREREKSERWLWNNELVKFTCKLKL